MEKTAHGKLKGTLLIVIIILLVVVLAAGSVFVWLVYKVKQPDTDTIKMPDEMLLSISCEGLYRDLYSGMDTSFEGYDAFSDIFPDADATEEQRREKADAATIGDAIRFYSEKANGYPEMKDKNYSEFLSTCVAKENGYIVPKEKLSESSGTNEKTALLDISLTVDTKLSDLFQNNKEIVNRDASILEAKKKILEQMSGS